MDHWLFLNTISLNVIKNLSTSCIRLYESLTEDIKNNGIELCGGGGTHADIEEADNFIHLGPT